MLLNCGVGKDYWESLGQQKDQTSQSSRKSVLNIHWKDWCWSWSSNTLATWWEELTHWERSWCWESLKAGGEGNNRGWDDWMTSPTRWTWVWVSSGSWQWTGKPGVLQPMGSQRVGHDWVTDLMHTFGALFCMYQFSSVAQSCLTLCDPMDCSIVGFPAHHQLLELSQTHVHRVSYAIQPSHPLSIPWPPAFKLSQHQDLFQWVSSLHQVAKVLEFQLQHQSFQWIFRTDFL